jgi:hypothetical protein
VVRVKRTLRRDKSRVARRERRLQD